MLNRAPQISDFEGLIYSTARRYADLLPDEDFDDVCQILRLKVWQALQAYDETRNSQNVQAFVFGCLVNRVKDLLKKQTRLNAARNGTMRYIEDVESAGYELAVEDQRLLAASSPPPLPPTLSDAERSVAVLIGAGHAQLEIASLLGVSPKTVRKMLARVQAKMADQRPVGRLAA